MTVKVSVIHGDLSEATHHILVGHYEGRPMDGAEATLDGRLRGALSAVLDEGTYPAALGTYRVFDGTVGVPGVIVVGLGTPDELSTQRLVDSASKALLGFAKQRIPEVNRNVPVKIAVSSLLVGSRSGGSLGVDDSVSAIVEAVVLANRQIADDSTMAEKVQLCEVEFVELYLQAAIEAVRALRRMRKRPPTALRGGEEIQANEILRRAPTGLPGTGWQDRFVSHIQRIDIKTSDNGFDFTLDTDQAAALTERKPVNWPNMDAILERAASTKDRFGKAARVLTSQVLPADLVDKLPGGADLHLVLDDGAAAVPWELLSPEPRGSSTPRMARIAVVRQLETHRGRAAPQQAFGGRALVIGEPAGVKPALPGARLEAEKVASLLTDRGHKVHPLINASADKILEALTLEPCDIVHVSGHGIFNSKDPLRSGVVLENGRYLTSIEFNDLPTPPTIVFLNCCYLGRLADGSPPHLEQLRDMGQLAASVSQQLIDGGVKVVVAAGWPIDDDAAVEFATALYDELLSGATLIKAVRVARRATCELKPRVNTWGAYQVYGDPLFRLEVSDARDLGSPEDLVTMLKEKRLEAIQFGRDEVHKERIASDLEALKEEMLPSWPKGLSFTAFGNAWRDLGDLDKAIEYYDKALGYSDAPVEAAEQKGNCQTRLALKQDETRPAEAGRRLAQQSIGAVQNLISAIGTSQERQSLLGSAYKSLALAQEGEDRETSLVSARDAYKLAVRMSKEELGSPHYYPLTNQVVFEILVDGPRSVLNDEIDDIVQSIEKESEQGPNVWTRIGRADAAALRAINNDDDGAEAQARTAYEAIFNTPGSGATERERESARNLYRFMLQLRPEASYAKRLRTFLAVLK